MDPNRFKELAPVALGEQKAPLVLKNAQVVNVFSGEILVQDVALCGDTIAGTGLYHGQREIDLTGRYLVPGFIDAHLHLESTMVAPPELIHCALCRGTTTFIVDPHEAANVAGTAGIDYILEQTEHTGANVFVMMPSCVPCAPGEDNGCQLTAELMAAYRDHPRILGLGELMDNEAVIRGEPGMMAKLELFRGKVLDGHAPALTGGALAAYALAGVETDHECTSYSQALEELRCGMQVLIREGSGAKNLEAIVRGMVEHGADPSGFSFCTDDKHIEDIRREGHIGYNVKKAVSLGLDPVSAIRMATIQTARRYRLHGLGAIAPGYRADLVVLDNLREVAVHQVYAGGQPVNPGRDVTPAPPSPSLLCSVRLPPLTKEDLRLSAGAAPLPAIAIQAGQILTERRDLVLPRLDGAFLPDAQTAKLVVAERHRNTGRLGICPVTGFHLEGGAIASSVSHDSHNVICVGDSDEAILLALNEIQHMQGGYAIVQGGRVAASLALPVMGLISHAGSETVSAKLEQMLALAHNMGVPMDVEPFTTLSFLALPVIPRLRLTTRGLYDVAEKRLLLPGRVCGQQQV